MKPIAFESFGKNLILDFAIWQRWFQTSLNCHNQSGRNREPCFFNWTTTDNSSLQTGLRLIKCSVMVNRVSHTDSGMGGTGPPTHTGSEKLGIRSIQDTRQFSQGLDWIDLGSVQVLYKHMFPNFGPCPCITLLSTELSFPNCQLYLMILLFHWLSSTNLGNVKNMNNGQVLKGFKVV